MWNFGSMKSAFFKVLLLFIFFGTKSSNKFENFTCVLQLFSFKGTCILCEHFRDLFLIPPFQCIDSFLFSRLLEKLDFLLHLFTLNGPQNVEGYFLHNFSENRIFPVFGIF